MSEENLRNRFPLSYRWIILKIAPWFFGVLLLLVAAEQILLSVTDISSDSFLFTLLFLGSLVIILRVIYLGLFLSTLNYSIVGDEFYIVRGVFFKKPVGVPIGKINAIHIQRTVPEILFGLATLVVVVPGDVPINLLSISGFSRPTAEALKAYIFSKN
jgi:uncharacterized membrane protein YdbT with pleckstrin-like domain